MIIAFLAPLRRSIWLLLWVMVVPAGARGETVSIGERAAAAVRTALSHAEPGTAESRIRLLDAALEGNRLTLNFSGEVHELGLGSRRFEEFAHEVDEAASDVLREHLRAMEFEFRIDGVPLPTLFEKSERGGAPTIARDARPPEVLEPRTQGVTGRRIAISPGHGYYLNGTTWGLQRPFLQGIVEDFVNHDIVTQLNALLVAGGADVRPTRNLDRVAGNGESGFAKWQEAARYHMKALGADASVWNEAGFTHLEQDIRCRPRYANAVEAELLVSIHNNAGGGTGTETLYDTGNAAAADSKRLADIVHGKVIAAIRRDYNPNWRDRLVKGFNGSYGENRLATRPAVIIEIAFMDMPTPDNAALQDERFKQLVASAVRDGIAEFLGGPVPIAAAGLRATGEAAAVALTWTDEATNETGFRIERKVGATGAWTPLATVGANVVSYRDTTATPGASHVYRVQAFNATGAAELYSNEATATTTAALPALVLASVTPAATLVRDWDEVVEFSLTVTDAGARPLAGATVTVRDFLLNRLLALETNAAGQASYRVAVPSGQANGSYNYSFQAVAAGFGPSATVVRVVEVRRPSFSENGAPTIALQPAATSVTAGGAVSLAVTASGAGPLSYLWRRNGVALAGATGATLTVAAASAGDAGDYSVVVTNSLGTATSVAAALTVDPAAWLSNVSLRTTLAAGQSVIVGFVVNGGAKDLLVRAIGPALVAFGLPTAMTDPRLELFRGSTKVGENNDWPTALAPTFASLGAFPLAVASRDAALLQTLSGSHTVQATGTAGGVVLIEGYDAGSGSGKRLVNLSARNRVGTGADVLIAGFFVNGTGSKRVLIRATGPALTAFGVPGVLADPKLEVNDGAVRIAENDDWNSSLAAVFAQVGAFPLSVGSKDSAVVLTLAAGKSYTVQVSGASGGVGEALVEVYEVP